MHSTPNSEQSDPRQIDPSVISLAPGDERLASDEQTVREALARVHERPSNADPDAPSVALDPQVTSFRPNAVSGSSGLQTVARGIFGVFLVGCVGAGAFAWQSSYGHTARLIVAELAPQLIPSSLLPGGKSESEAQPSAATAQAASAEAAAQPVADAADANPPQPATEQQPAAEAQPAPPPAAAQAAVQDAATAAASSSPPDQAQLLQTMARDLAAAQKRIAELETSQQQLVRENAATSAQLKAAQEQVAHLAAKPTEPKVSEAKPAAPGASNAKLYAQALRPKPPAAPRRPVTTYPRPVAAAQPGLPRPLAPPPQASAEALPPAPLPAQIVQPSPDQVQMSSAPRPPMPVPQ
jgi:chemotaxis protein histidine kinase CheA